MPTIRTNHANDENLTPDLQTMIGIIAAADLVG